MRSLFLSPHHDDETLFGAFTLLRDKPTVVICTRADIQDQRGTGITHERRLAETRSALAILGVDDWSQWTFSDTGIEMFRFMSALRQEVRKDWDHVYAPAFEEGGHEQHNQIAQAVAEVFPPEMVTSYLTYTNGRSRSQSSRKVEYEQGWILKKLQALACYESQILLPSTGHHFLACQDEFYAA